MFRNYGILVGQVLVTKPDFHHEDTRNQVPTSIGIGSLESFLFASLYYDHELGSTQFYINLQH
jgi:hypothetical protein